MIHVKEAVVVCGDSDDGPGDVELQLEVDSHMRPSMSCQHIACGV